MDDREVTVTRDQQEELDPILGEAYLLKQSYPHDNGQGLGLKAQDLVMAAYKLGRKHG